MCRWKRVIRVKNVKCVFQKNDGNKAIGSMVSSYEKYDAIRNRVVPRSISSPLIRNFPIRGVFVCVKNMQIIDKKKVRDRKKEEEKRICHNLIITKS